MTSEILRVRVLRKHNETAEIACFELAAAEGGNLPAFSAGSHIDVHLPNGMTRQYSLCNDPAESHRYEIAVLRDDNGRGGSLSMHRDVIQDAIISISVPKNHFSLSKANNHLLIAGGVGITPIICMAEKLSATNESFSMHYYARSSSRAAFLERIREARYGKNVRFHFDEGPPAERLDIKELLGNAAVDAHLYTCGPRGFMELVLSNARALSWTEDRLHYEFFGGGQVKAQSDESFEVIVASSGRVVVVSPEETVISALARDGVQIPFSCEQGVCGTCMTRVLDGIPDHRDLYLTPDEQAANNVFMPCCSRARSSTLVLDL